jgi:hypothetical protein
MRVWILGLAAALVSGVAQAKDANEHYAQAGAWEIAAEPARNLCKMFRYYGSTEGPDIEGLVVRYDAGSEAVSITWATGVFPYLPETGDLDLFVNFIAGDEFDESWGSRSFHYRKDEETYYLSHEFAGPKESSRILRDLGGNEIVGFYLGPVLMSALFLEASDAVAALRECSLKIARRT